MKRKSLMKKGIAIATAVFTVFASSSSILAYEPFVSIDKDGSNLFNWGEEGMFLNTQRFSDYDFSMSDEMFVYEDGTKILVTDKDSMFAICNHVMVDGYYSVHKSNSTGGCTVKEFKAKRCNKCGYIDVGNLYATHTYPVCPHK